MGLGRTLSQIAWAAVASKGSKAQPRFPAGRPRLGAQKAIWAVAHYPRRVIWKARPDEVRYRSPDTERLQRRALLARAKRVLSGLRKLGYTVSITPPSAIATPGA